MVKKIILSIVSGVLFCVSACVRAPTYPPYPIITMQGVSRTVLNLNPAIGYTVDSVLITIGFTDGEGGIGAIDPGGTDTSSLVPCTVHSNDINIINSPVYNLFWYEYQQGPDSCIGESYTASLPDNPKQLSVSGTIQFSQTLECPPVGNIDTIYFSVFLKDRNGKISNRVRTPGIIVNCAP